MDSRKYCWFKWWKRTDALNETFADIFGTSVEWFARPSQHDWLMGLDISTNGTAIRNMSNPNAIQQPDTYQNLLIHQQESHMIMMAHVFIGFIYYLLAEAELMIIARHTMYHQLQWLKLETIAYRAMTTYMTLVQIMLL